MTFSALLLPFQDFLKLLEHMSQPKCQRLLHPTEGTFLVCREIEKREKCRERVARFESRQRQREGEMRREEIEGRRGWIVKVEGMEMFLDYK